jgi:hypothetical protein
MAEPVVPVIRPDGSVGTLPETQADRSVKDGRVKYATPKDVEKARKRQEAADAPVRAFAEGAAREATFGASDYLLQQAGVEQEGLALRREENPVASGAGEAVGFAGGMLVPGVNVAKGVTKAGQLAAKGVTKALGTKLAEKTVGKVARGVAEGVAEGGIQGLREAITDDALGNAGLSGETAVARMLQGAGIGAAFGGGVAGSGAILGGLSASVKRTATRLTGAKTADALADKLTLDVLEGRAGALKKAGIKSTADAGELGGFLRREKVLQKASDDIETIKGRLDEVVATKGAKVGQMVDELDARGATASLSAVARQVDDEVMTKLAAGVDPRAAKTLRRQLGGIFQEADLAAKSGTEAVVPVSRIRDLRTSLDDQIKWAATTASPTADALKDIRRILENTWEKAGDDVAKGEFLASWKAAKKEYSLAKRAQEIAASSAERAAQQPLAKSGLTERLMQGGLTAAGLVAGGPLGAAAGLASGVLLPKAMSFARERGDKFLALTLDRATKLRAMDAAATQTQNVIVKGAKRVFGEAGNAAKGAAITAAIPAGVRQEDRADISAARRVFEATQAQDGVTYAQKLTANLDAEAFPTVAAGAASSATTAHEILAKAAAAASPTPTATQRMDPPTQDDVHEFRVIQRVLANPTSLLDAAAKGTLDPMALEAVQRTYPQMYQSMVQAMRAGMAARTTALDSRERAAARMILGPVDSLQASVKRLQAAYGAPAAPTAATPAPGPSRPLMTPGQAGKTINAFNTLSQSSTRR